ncbi:MAG: Nif3-like dinuclear metal center hexameric protein [Clostridia bacterium]|nr:Nif3-like dinuclear metal center hexameric protein [Clostridia bacterium]
MTVKQLYEQISDRIPASLSCEWDNDGLLLSPDEGNEVRRVLCTLDVTEEAVEYAVENGFDLIISHHPLIFKPLSSLTPDEHVARKAIRLLSADISVISLHTRADAVFGGVNDRLAKMLGLLDVEPFGEEGIARIGELDESVDLPEFALRVKRVLGAPAVMCADTGLPARRVAVCGGEGGDFVSEASAAGADTYVSGRIGYHRMTDAPEMGINMIEAGHFYTENHITAFFCDLVSEIAPNAFAQEFDSGVIFCL